jgi:hypothetical protein
MRWMWSYQSHRLRTSFMTHDELLKAVSINSLISPKALKQIVELHSPIGDLCDWCTCQDDDHIVHYPCKTILIIEDAVNA